MLDTKLETLLVLHQEQNFTRASIRLGITQPAVSTHIKQLEEEYGCKLLIRSKNDIKPTEKGEIVINYAKRLKSLHQKMVDELKDSEKTHTKIRIGITHSAENGTLTKILSSYAMENHTTSLTIITDTIKNLYNMLETYELDLIIVEEKKDKPNLNYLPLGSDEIVAVVSKDNPLSAKNYVDLDDLKNEKMIMRLPTSATRQLFDSTLISVNESVNNFNIILEVDNISTIKELVLQNIGVTILPKALCANEISNGKLKALPIAGLSMIRETDIVYLNDFTQKKVLTELVSLYKKLA